MARGVNGTITSVSAATLQVQSAASGNASIVSYSASTKITDTVAGTLADVKAGSCVTVRSATAQSGTPLVASSISVGEPVNGSCAGGPGGGRPTGSPEWTPSARPSGAARTPNPSRSPGAGMGVFGSVQAVSGTAITVAAVSYGGGTPTTATETVQVNGQTSVTKHVDSTAASLKAGRCVLVTGQTDGAGVTTATSLALSDPVNGQCAMAGRGGYGRGNG